MKFFMNRHYSTAQKIIKLVEKKIIAGTKIRILDYVNKKYNPLLLHIDLANSRKLAENLGNVLKNNIPEYLYDKYQRLSVIEKNKLRELLAKDYLNAVVLQTQQLKNIDIEIDAFHDKWGDDVSVTITLPREFNDNAFLFKVLTQSISAINETLIEAKNDKPKATKCAL